MFKLFLKRKVKKGLILPTSFVDLTEEEKEKIRG